MPSESFKIESATIEDLPRLTDLLFELFNQESDFTPDRSRQMRGLRLILEEPNRGRIFVLRCHDKIIGMINLLSTISTAEGGFVMLLEDMYIMPEHRGQGYGERLLNHAIDYARQKGFLRITLLSDKMEQDAQFFFQKHGFKHSGMIPMRLHLEGAQQPAQQGD